MAIRCCNAKEEVQQLKAGRQINVLLYLRTYIGNINFLLEDFSSTKASGFARNGMTKLTDKKLCPYIIEFRFEEYPVISLHYGSTQHQHGSAEDHWGEVVVLLSGLYALVASSEIAPNAKPMMPPIGPPKAQPKLPKIHLFQLDIFEYFRLLPKEGTKILQYDQPDV